LGPESIDRRVFAWLRGAPLERGVFAVCAQSLEREIVKRRANTAALVRGQDVKRAQEALANGDSAGRHAFNLGHIDLDLPVGQRLRPDLADRVVRKGEALGRIDVCVRADCCVALDRQERVGRAGRSLIKAVIVEHARSR
jgi:hypothetical protein